jgi:SH3-like domain-containing protein
MAMPRFRVYQMVLTTLRPSNRSVAARLRAISAAAMTLALACIPPAAANEAPVKPAPGTGLPVPRFVSLKAEKVNVRGGPTKEHDVAWIFTRAGLPVEITAEYDNWRRIRDWEGSEGWVYHSMLSGRRTAMVTPNPKAKDALLTLRDKADTQTAVVARLQAGVVATVKKCSPGWCRISGPGFDGWIEQERLFGVYPNEKLE